MEYIKFRTLKSQFGTVKIQQNIPVTVERKVNGKVKKVRDKIRYVEGLDSIYVSLQRKEDPDAIETNVFMVKGKISVDSENKPLIDFLKKHPHYGINFTIVDVDKDDLYEIAQFETTHEAKELVIKGSENFIKAVSINLLGTSYRTRTVTKLKKLLLLRLDSDYLFVQDLIAFEKDKSSEQFLMITLALSLKVIDISEGKKIVWYGTKDVLYIGSQAKDVLRDFSVWLRNDDEGRTSLKAIADKINSIEKK